MGQRGCQHFASPHEGGREQSWTRRSPCSPLCAKLAIRASLEGDVRFREDQPAIASKCNRSMSARATSIGAISPATATSRSPSRTSRRSKEATRAPSTSTISCRAMRSTIFTSRQIETPSMIVRRPPPVELSVRGGTNEATFELHLRTSSAPHEGAQGRK
jgi:hypothetical protein